MSAHRLLIPPLRIVSLLPAATEIVNALGMMDHVVGVSHECNYPESARTKPRVTGCEIHGEHVPSKDIDQWVSQKLSKGEDLFTLDEAKLRELRPNLILTQRLCDVCAPAYGSVMASPASFHGPHPAGCNFLMMDGSCRVIQDSFSLPVFRALCTRNGGEVIPGDVFE